MQRLVDEVVEGYVEVTRPEKPPGDTSKIAGINGPLTFAGLQGPYPDNVEYLDDGETDDVDSDIPTDDDAIEAIAAFLA